MWTLGQCSDTLLFFLVLLALVLDMNLCGFTPNWYTSQNLGTWVRTKLSKWFQVIYYFFYMQDTSLLFKRYNAHVSPIFLTVKCFLICYYKWLVHYRKDSHTVSFHPCGWNTEENRRTWKKRRKKQCNGILICSEKVKEDLKLKLTFRLCFLMKPCIFHKPSALGHISSDLSRYQIIKTVSTNGHTMKGYL